MKSILFVVTLAIAILSSSVYAAPPMQPKINLNTANVQQLIQTVKGIGKKRAEAIIHYRETHGQFKSVEDLANVRGLGKSFVQSHKTQLQEKFVI
jgi:competence protein ComEA